MPSSEGVSFVVKDKSGFNPADHLETLVSSMSINSPSLLEGKVKVEIKIHCSMLHFYCTLV
jgi:hypothetical protein